MDNNSYDTAFRYMDKLFPLMPEHRNFLVGDLIQQTDLDHKQKLICASVSDEIRIILVNFKYAEYIKAGWFAIILTPLGREIKNSGGHFGYLRKQQEQSDLNRRKDIVDLKTKEFIYRARLIPYIFSALALVGTTVSIFLSVRALKNNKDEQMKQPMQQTIQLMPKYDTSNMLDTSPSRPRR